MLDTGAPAAGGAVRLLRSQLALTLLLLGLAAGAWWWTAREMSGMPTGPTADLGTLGWFVGVWLVMMAAMMFPSLAPTVALFARMTRRHGLERPLIFTLGYLVVWVLAGLVAYGLFELGRQALGSRLAWSSGGRWLDAAVLALAAVYELTPAKSVCLGRCRSPLGFLLSAWHDGRRGALGMGVRHAAWCLGCCWALMAALFALGVMSLTWMAVVAVLIAIEKMLPWRRVATRGATVLLAALALGVIVAPGQVPGFAAPAGGGAGMHAMSGMR